MQDVPQERSGADAPPLGEAMSPVCFAGLVFDLGACTLARESGEAIPLTRGEFRLLRLFVSRPGRVLSRDAILEAVANRPLELFDRSVDALVVRLRRKIEPDPKAPRLIVTVPGEGYRFDGLAPRGGANQPGAASDPQVVAEPPPKRWGRGGRIPPGQTARRHRLQPSHARAPDEIMAGGGGRRRSRCRAVRRRRLWLAVGPRPALHGKCGGGQAWKCAASFNRRPAVREYERRQGAGLFR